MIWQTLDVFIHDQQLDYRIASPTILLGTVQQVQCRLKKETHGKWGGGS